MKPESIQKSMKNQARTEYTDFLKKYARRERESSIFEGPGYQNTPKMALKINTKIDEKSMSFLWFFDRFWAPKTLPKASKKLPKNDTQKESEHVTEKTRKINL